MPPPGTGRPRCWATGPPGGSCSATPSSSWPRNTDSGPGPSFRADIQRQRTAGSRPPSRLWGQGSGGYASQADGLFTELRRGDPGALARLRYAAATDASTAELRDARLIVAREVGFPTWRELVAGAEKSQRDAAEREERWRRMRPEAEALLAGDSGRLAHHHSKLTRQGPDSGDIDAAQAMHRSFLRTGIRPSGPGTPRSLGRSSGRPRPPRSVLKRFFRTVHGSSHHSRWLGSPVGGLGVVFAARWRSGEPGCGGRS